MRAAILAAFFLLVASTAASAHGIYIGLSNSKGQVCCNDGDCKPVELKDFRRRVDAGGNDLMSVQRDGKWYDVDPNNILESPDSHMHACVYFGEVRCFLMPQGD